MWKCYVCGERWTPDADFFGSGIVGHGDQASTFVGGPLDGLQPTPEIARCNVFIMVQVSNGEITGQFSHFYVKSRSNTGSVHFGYGGARTWMPKKGDAPKPATVEESRDADNIVRGCL